MMFVWAVSPSVGWRRFELSTRSVGVEHLGDVGRGLTRPPHDKAEKNGTEIEGDR
jgi:hypothetical protein